MILKFCFQVLQDDNLSNDVPEEDLHSISQSNIIHDTGPQTTPNSNAFEPEKHNTTNVPLYINNTQGKLKHIVLYYFYLKINLKNI